MSNIDAAATKVLNNFSTKRARKGTTALKRAGVSEFDTRIIRDLLCARAILQCDRGWFIRA
uniref:Uncharacterized protein n=1 Tax=uncultured marine virus TaxID=186617 RepID=A0A0F7LAI7_9VIRU|nr:hypothetical protein [uncultured marine virus]